MSTNNPTPTTLSPERTEESAREPLSAERRAEIQETELAATPGPWEPYPDYGKHFVAYLRGEHLIPVGSLDFGDGEDAEADRAFVLKARTAVPELLAEVERLRAELAATVRAKQENDERFQLAVAEQRDRAEKAEARVAELEQQTTTARTEAIADVGDWLDEIGQKDAAYLVYTCDIPVARDMKVVSQQAAEAGDVDEMAASLARDGFGPDEIAEMLHRGTEGGAR